MAMVPLRFFSEASNVSWRLAPPAAKYIICCRMAAKVVADKTLMQQVW